MSGPSGYAPEPKLAAFYTALERILHTGRQEHQDFQVYIADEENKKNKNGNITTYYHDASTRSATRRVVNFMCFSTGVALKELTKLGVRSLILTSGTLSPMEAMKEDLKLPFVVELQNPHVIK
ncbi:hypothetical protein EON65_21350 [archaeon]|nr:MAG: hypothetical protein EON65_21350 [archaeon]